MISFCQRERLGAEEEETTTTKDEEEKGGGANGRERYAIGLHKFSEGSVGAELNDKAHLWFEGRSVKLYNVWVVQLTTKYKVKMRAW